ncbi:MAG: coenzyme F420-0:L-glutamate ligase [Promethearchaeota archaeon]
MEIISIKTPIIKIGDDLLKIFLDSIEEMNVHIQSGDIIAVAETVMATGQGRIVDLDDVKIISEKAKELANKYDMNPKIVQIIMNEADEIVGGVDHVLLTKKSGLLLANAGVDASNAGGISKLALLPKNPWNSIQEFRIRLEQATNTRPLGSLLIDSRVQPLKKGVIGGALAVSGFKPVEDKRGVKDLFGRPLLITQIAVADDLASAAELMMGEADEQTPFVLIRDAPVKFVDDSEIKRNVMEMPEDECLFMNVFKEYRKNTK